MSFLQEFKNRGYLYQCTNILSLEKKISQQKISAYIGFDCTAKSLHVGNLMQIMILRLLQKHGHKPIVLIGGSTTKVGDPTGKEKLRKYLTDSDISNNIIGIKESLSKFIKFGDGSSDAIILNNACWLENIGYIEFLRKIGCLVSVNKMLNMDSVRQRLERKQALTFLEFNYTLLQAYDFYYLNKEYNCNLQLGGSDQWGNIISGIDLARKISGEEELFGLTTPLLTTSSGTKMGKSIRGAVWLNEQELSVYDYYQYWRNTEDKDVVRFAKLYCEYNDKDLNNFEQLALDDINEAKKNLAYKITSLCHGKEKATNVMETSIIVFEQGDIGDELPLVNIELLRLKKGISCLDLFYEIGITKSKGETRRLIRARGAKVNDIKIMHEHEILYDSALIDGVMKLSVGRKKHFLVKAITV